MLKGDYNFGVLWFIWLITLIVLGLLFIAYMIVYVERDRYKNKYIELSLQLYAEAKEEGLKTKLTKKKL